MVDAKGAQWASTKAASPARSASEGGGSALSANASASASLR
jgi:hypothetical protein